MSAAHVTAVIITDNYNNRSPIQTPYDIGLWYNNIPTCLLDHVVHYRTIVFGSMER